MYMPSSHPWKSSYDKSQAAPTLTSGSEVPELEVQWVYCPRPDREGSNVKSLIQTL